VNEEETTKSCDSASSGAVNNDGDVASHNQLLSGNSRKSNAVSSSDDKDDEKERTEHEETENNKADSLVSWNKESSTGSGAANNSSVKNGDDVNDVNMKNAADVICSEVKQDLLKAKISGGKKIVEHIISEHQKEVNGMKENDEEVIRMKKEYI